MVQIISSFGSLAILAAYAAGQFKFLDPNSFRYVILNLVGSSILTAVAIIETQWGFLLLEGSWAIISLFSLIKLLRSVKTNSPH